jgi:hypothetical protein
MFIKYLKIWKRWTFCVSTVVQTTKTTKQNYEPSHGPRLTCSMAAAGTAAAAARTPGARPCPQTKGVCVFFVFEHICVCFEPFFQNFNQKTARPLAQDLPAPRGEHKYGRRTSPKFATIQSLIFRFARRRVCPSISGKGTVGVSMGVCFQAPVSWTKSF